jgi:DNA (cytosine-5)-methyltransferase 1
VTRTALDLCSGGAGGWSLGAHRAGVATAAACEAVPWRRRLFAANFPGVPIYDDLRTLTAAQVRRDLGYFPEFVFGSPPCKEYSSVNSRAGGLDADDLFLHAVRLVDEGRPRWCGFENSPFVKDRGYDRIAAALEAVGYTVWPFVVGVGNTGGAHKRHRAFVVAADLSRPQGRPAGQPRPHLGVVADLHGVGGRPRAGGEDRAQADNGGEAVARLAEQRLGSAGAQPLGGHLREYDGLPSWVAERCRQAFGDAVSPAVAEVVVRAILDVDARLPELIAA